MANLVVLNCSRACAYALRARDTDTRQSHKRRHDWAKILNYEGELFAELILSIFIFFLIIFIILSHVLSVKIGMARQRE